LFVVGRGAPRPFSLKCNEDSVGCRISYWRGANGAIGHSRSHKTATDATEIVPIEKVRTAVLA
jgi:hypothetical protein